MIYRLFHVTATLFFLVLGFSSTEPLSAQVEDKELRIMDWQKEPFKILVTLGESTTAGGWSSNRNRCWASRLTSLINDMQVEPVKLVNAGIGANVISTRSPSYDHSGKPAAASRLDKHVLAHHPDLLVISYGLNDARGGTPLDLFVNEMENIIDRVREQQQQQPLIVLLGPYFMTDFTVGGKHWSHGSLKLFYQYNEQIRQVATDKDCLFVDLLAAYQDTPWMVHRDGVHANDLGHLIVAMEIFKVLAQNCSGLAKKTEAFYDQIPPWRDESTLRADYGFEGPGKFGPK